MEYKRNLRLGVEGYTDDETVLVTYGNVGIGTENPTSKLTVDGDANISGTIIATSFSGNATSSTSAGTATTATNLADAANILTGTINKDRISNTNSLTVLGDLYVSNNISFAGTTTQLNAEQLQIVDPDIVLGIGTSFSPTDNTANHGGIAIASNEGSPLVNLNIVPQETTPSTYKKMMWFKGDTIGAGITDAWLFNYAVGIGSTQVPIGVRLAAGNVQFTENDLSKVRNINASGIVTTGTLNVGVGGTIITTTGIGSVGIGSTQPNATLVLNAPSGYTGNVLDLQVGGSSRVFVNNQGGIVGNQTDNVFDNAQYGIAGSRASGFGGAAGEALIIANSTWRLSVSGTSAIKIRNPLVFTPDGSQSLVLDRDADNVLAQRNAGAGQTFRIYNTYTSASQYERAYLGWNNNTFQIGVDTAGISTARPISLVGAAATNNLQPLQINQTWTTGTGIATALTLNVTDTSSSSSSKLLDLRVSGSSKFDIDKSGNLRLSSGTGGNLSFSFSQLYLGNSTDGVNVQTGQTFTTLIKGSKAYGWCSLDNTFTGPGLTLFRDADGILAQRGTIGPGSGDNTKLQQVFRIYNTWTNSTNSFERANVGWSTNVFIVGTEKGSSIGTARPMHFQTDGTTRVAITTTGLVGMGTTQPTEALEVAGNVKATKYYGEPEISPVMMSMLF